MQMLVLGAGQQGTACAFDLLSTTDATVTIADSEEISLPPFLGSFSPDRLRVKRLDVRNETAVREVMQTHDAVMSAVPYYFNFELARAAVGAGAHFVDLGGNTEIVRQQEGLDEAAKKAGVSIMPDCGLAPGMVNVLAADGVGRMDKADSAKLFVGGLPQHPEPPLNYQIVYSLEGALDYYTTPSWVLRDSRPAEVDPLSEVEHVEFPEPVGCLEAFHTAGGLSTMPWDFEGRVGTMEYKTLRYPGHAAIMRAVRDLGLVDLAPVDVNGVEVRPRDAFIAIVEPQLRKPEGHDLVALRVTVTGTKGGRSAVVNYRLLDRFDETHGISAMMRTTGYSLSIAGQLQTADRVGGSGVRAAYHALPAADYIEELARRGIRIEVDETA